MAFFFETLVFPFGTPSIRVHQGFTWENLCSHYCILVLYSTPESHMDQHDSLREGFFGFVMVS